MQALGVHLLLKSLQAECACWDMALRKVMATGTTSTSSSTDQHSPGKGSVWAMSWHSILGVACDAGYSDIRAAFKRRVLEAHPDKGGSAHEFQEIMFAFEKATCAVPTDGSVARKTASTTRSSQAKVPSTSCRFVGRFSRFSKVPRGNCSVRQSWNAAKQHAKPTKEASTSTGPRFGGPWSKQRILRQLHACLQRLPRADRQVALKKHLKQRHRLELENWITSHPMRDSVCRTPAERMSGVALFGGDVAKLPAGGADDNGEMLLAIADVSEHFDVQEIDADVVPDTGQRLRKGIIRRNIKRQKYDPLYVVLVVINNLELFSAGTNDLAKAVDLHIALTSLKRRITQNPALMSRFDAEVVHALQEQDISTSQARLSLRIHFPVHHWTGRQMRSPTYPWAEVQATLAAWKTMQRARLEYSGLGAKKGGVFFLHTPASVESAWRAISRIYIDTWVAAGWDLEDLQTQVDSMRKAHATSSCCQLTVWNQYRMECEDRRHRLLERLMRKSEARERRELAREDRRASQMEAKTRRLLSQVDRLIVRWEDRRAKDRVTKSRRRKRCVPRWTTDP